jgi:hypothetical protein
VGHLDLWRYLAGGCRFLILDQRISIDAVGAADASCAARLSRELRQVMLQVGESRFVNCIIEGSVLGSRVGKTRGM